MVLVGDSASVPSSWPIILLPSVGMLAGPLWVVVAYNYCVDGEIVRDWQED